MFKFVKNSENAFQNIYSLKKRKKIRGIKETWGGKSNFLVYLVWAVVYSEMISFGSSTTYLAEQSFLLK
jgi:hypothetical protein